jgi:rhodanese-related sulfurtransferase
MSEAQATSREIAPADAAGLVATGAPLIDVRTDAEWQHARIPGATHVQLQDLPAHAAALDPAQEIVLYCRSGSRSGMAAEALNASGYNARNLSGGIRAWIEEGREVEPAGTEVP